MKANLFEMASCPWTDWRPTRFFFCEEPLCQWIQQPANTISNLFYLVAAILIWLRWKTTHPKIAKQLVFNLILIFLGSFLLHSSMTFVGEVADMGAMFFLLSTMIVWNLDRFYGRALGSLGLLFWLLGSIPILFFATFDVDGNLLMLGASVVVFVLELGLLQRRKEKISYRWALAVVVTFLVAVPIWWFEATNTWCTPHSHGVTGHVIWHILTAISVLFIAEFYSQFHP